jgi:hypothetical protein
VVFVIGVQPWDGLERRGKIEWVRCYFIIETTAPAKATNEQPASRQARPDNPA